MISLKLLFKGQQLKTIRDYYGYNGTPGNRIKLIMYFLASGPAMNEVMKQLLLIKTQLHHNTNLINSLLGVTKKDEILPSDDEIGMTFPLRTRRQLQTFETSVAENPELKSKWVRQPQNLKLRITK